MNIEIANSFTAYHRWLDQVRDLFTKVFSRPLPAVPWRLYYECNPYGEPLVALAIEDGRVVGHHALIPQVLQGPGNESVFYLHSMSLMLDPDWRAKGLFFKLLFASHAAAAASGAALILGFPNRNSAGPLRAFFGHQCVATTPLLDWALPADLPEVKPLIEPLQSIPGNSLSHPLYPPYWPWRTALNGARAITINKKLALIYKLGDNGLLTVLDVEVLGSGNVWLDFLSFSKSIGATEVRIIGVHAARISIPETQLRSHDDYCLRLYAKPLRGVLPPIRISLLLSDVF
jgi:GNAT superfamily N-acetyltransferase